MIMWLKSCILLIPIKSNILPHVIQNGLVMVYFYFFFSKINSFIALGKNKNLEYYLDYLQQHRNAESRIEYALQLCNQSKSVNRIFNLNEERKKNIFFIAQFINISIIVSRKNQADCWTFYLEFYYRRKYPRTFTKNNLRRCYHYIRNCKICHENVIRMFVYMIFFMDFSVE